MNFSINRSNKIILTALVVVTVVLAGCTSNASQNTNTASNEPVETMTTTALPSSTTTGSGSATQSSYKDGTYKSTGSYTSPAGPEKIEVSVTLTGGKISAAEVTPKATHPTSTLKQNAFKSGFSTEVVGKSIDEVSLGAINGSSLTPKGFMNALEDIKKQANS